MKNAKKLHVLCAALLIVVLLASCIPAQADGGTGNLYMYVRTGNSGRLHLRAMPSTASQSLGLYANGTPVLVESIANNWAFVTVNGRRGYMMLSCLTGVAPNVPVSPAVTPVPTEDTTLYVRTGNSGRLHLREFASQSARSLGLYANGTPVRVTARSGAWAFVTVGGNTGYMMLQFLTATVPSQPYPVPVIQPGSSTLMYVRTGNSGKLHLREYASQSARSLGLYPNGTPVLVYATMGAWVHVSVGGQTGYMMAQFLSASAPAVDPVTPPPSMPGTAVVTHPNGSFVYLRSSPNSNNLSNVLDQVPSGTLVEVLSWDKYWSVISYKGVQGYMVTNYLK